MHHLHITGEHTSPITGILSMFLSVSEDSPSLTYTTAQGATHSARQAVLERDSGEVRLYGIFEGLEDWVLLETWEHMPFEEAIESSEYIGAAKIVDR